MDNLSPSAQASLAALTELGQGNVHEIREKSGKARSTTDKAIRELAEAGLIVAVETDADPAEGVPTRWELASPTGLDDITDPETANDDGNVIGRAQPELDATEGDLDQLPADQTAAEADNILDNADADTDAEPEAAQIEPDADAENTSQNQPESDLEDADQDLLDGDADNQDDADDADADADNFDNEGDDSDDDGEDGDDDGEDSDEDAEPVSAQPNRPADRRVMAIRGTMFEHPDGMTPDAISSESGFALNVVVRLLAAMEQVDAARRIPADKTTGTPELWIPGPGKANEVDPNPAPPRCPTCNQVIRAARAASTPATSSSGTRTTNNGGDEAFGRGELRTHTLKFINARPGHVLTPQVIASGLEIELGRTAISSGAVRNNCTTLAAAGQITLASETPLAFTAITQPADDNGSEQ